jgi:hypothetical protein
MPKEFAVEGDGGSVAIVVQGYERRDAEDASDANWLTAHVRLKIGPFTAEYGTSITTQALVSLLNGLGRVVEDLSGTTALTTDEDDIAFEVVAAVGGAMRVSGTARRRGLPRVALQFEFQSDQSYLRRTVQQLEDLTAMFPVVTART